jgi:hypothetical protein
MLSVMLVCFDAQAQGGCSGTGGHAAVENVVPCDPNEIVGPEGFGSAGFVRVVDGTYTIFFENLSTAAVPAQEVVVVVDLDPALDASTIELGEVGFGSQLVTELIGRSDGRFVVPLAGTDFVVELAVQLEGTQRLKWILRTIDPRTGDLPNEVEVGFLPPNDAGGRGEGHVTFRIRSQEGLPSGTPIECSASIAFDTNPEIRTNNWLNTIDSSPPTSTVADLPLHTRVSAIDVRWTGSDDSEGSGIANGTLFVSQDDGPFSAWATVANGGGATYVGQVGHHYGFYGIATDNVGNIEAKASAAEARTEILTNQRPIANAGEPQTFECTGNGGASVVLNGSESTDPDGNALTYLWTADGLAFDDPTSPTPAAQFPLGGTIVTLVVNNGVEDSDPDYVTITVVDRTSPSVTCPAPATHECDGARHAVVAMLSAVGIDGCQPELHWTNDHTGDGADASGSYALGTTVVTFQAEDASGNTATCSTTVTVVDSLPPSGRVVAPSDGSCLGPSQLPVTIVDDFMDACDPALARSYEPGPGPTYSEHGDQSVILTAVDSSGNGGSASVAFTIDTIAPSVALLQPRGGAVLLPGTFPFTVVFHASDDDGAAGAVLHEVVKLQSEPGAAYCVIYDGATYGNGDGLLSDETLTVSVGELCRLAAVCGFASLNKPEIRVEAMDCGGNVGFDAHRFSGSVLPLRPGMCAGNQAPQLVVRKRPVNPTLPRGRYRGDDRL